MAFDLAGFSEAAAEAVAAAGKSVVRVDGRNRDSASGIVWSSDGLIVTASHVVKRSEEITIGVGDEEATRPAQLIGRDPATDLALLRVEADDALVSATWSADDSLCVGAFVWAVARPEQSLQATLGVVSKLWRRHREQSETEEDTVIRTDVLMYPGFSGGALVDAAGNVVGINSSALMRGASGALGHSTVARVVSTLLQHGRMPRAFLGAGVQPVRLSTAIAEASGQESGLMVMSVEVDGPATQGGIAQGDVLLTLDGEPLRTLDDLMRSLRSDRAGKQATIAAARGGAIVQFVVSLGSK